MPIRIMHVVDSLGKGGLENGLANLIQRLDPKQFEHTVLAMRHLGPNADRLPSNRVQVRCLGKKETGSRIQIGVLARAIRESKPDIVHSRNWAAIEAVIAGRWVHSCALVHSEHGLESDVTASEPWRRICFRRLAFELADRVLAVSHHLRDLHARRTGFPAHRITVIHNGVDSQRFFPDPAARLRVRQELGFSDSEFCIGCVANLLPVKDHMTLFRAVERMHETRKDWKVLIVGEGSQRPKLESFVNGRPEWKRQVFFLGSSHRVPELLNAMDVYVLPSLNEGISNSLLEAMATGLPVIASATGGNLEVVTDGNSGLLFPIGNFRQLAEQLLSLGTAQDLRLRLGQQARRRVRKEFSLDSMVQQYEQIYESLGSRTRTARLSAVGA